MERVRLKNLFEKPISGDWGNECNGQNKCTEVIRSTNFTNDIRYKVGSELVKRSIDKDKINNIKLRFGDIIIEKSGGSPNQPVGRVLYYDFNDNIERVCNNFTSILRPLEKYNSKYLSYLLLYLYKKGMVLKFQNKTTGIINLKLENYLKYTEVDIPNIDIQNKIVEILDKIQSLIDKRKEQVIFFDTLVKSRFIDMFGEKRKNKVDFFDIHLGEICEIGSSKRIFEKEYVSEGIPFYRTKEVAELSKGEKISTELFISEENFLKIKEKYGIPKKDDILITAVGTIGLVWVVDDNRQFYYKDGNLLIIKASKNFNSIYLKYFLIDCISNYMLKMPSGTAYSAITIMSLKKMKIPLPPIELQNQFADFVKSIDKSKLAVKKSLEELEILKKSLMQKYFG